MNTLKFTTNIESETARDEIFSVLKSDHRISYYFLNLAHPQKPLTVIGEIESSEVIIKVQSIGFSATEIK